MKFQVSSEFGELSWVRDMRPHTGIDLAMPEGTTLRAIGEGVIDKVFTGEGAIGKGLSIQTEDGTRAIYGHMNKVDVRVGEHVSANDVLGLSGNTGHSTAAHLHFSLRSPDGTFQDPTPLAEQLANISGNDVSTGPLSRLADWGADTVREKAADMTTEIVLGIFDALKDLLLGVTLIGSAVLILARVAGWRDGGRYAGLLLVANILIKFLFGVY